MIIINYEEGVGDICCDEGHCPNSETYETTDKKELYGMAKEEGWRAKKYTDRLGREKWPHFCPACVEDWKNQKQEERENEGL